MKQFFFIALMLCGTMVIAQQQFEIIDKQCADYDQQIKTAIEEETPEAVPSIKITSMLMKRAIGPVNHEIVIWFDEYEQAIEEEETETFNKEAVIRKVGFQLKSVSYDITYSYYFNDGGLLIRYNETYYTTDGCGKTTYHFQKENAIRAAKITAEGENCDDPNETNESYQRTTLTKEDKAEASYILADAKKFRELLFLNYELIKN